VSGERPLVLVADDDEDILLLVTTTLTRAGFEVIQARDGKQALDLTRAEAPQVVVLDIAMPELDGLTVLRRLRADAATADLPVVLLSARAQEADVARGYAEGASKYVAKPFRPSELVDAVNDLLAGES
jgi:DNA-binding response OmpR family regulator